VGRVDWILGQTLFWLLVVSVIVTGLVGIRRAGAVLAAHQAGLVGGRDVEGPGRGVAQAGSDLAAWWGVGPGGAGDLVAVEVDAERRSIGVQVRGAMRTLLGERAALGAGSFQRLEAFYPGPPAGFE